MKHRIGTSFFNYLIVGGSVIIVKELAFVFSRVFHYSDAIMRAMASQIISVSIVCSTVCSGADQQKYQSSMPLVLVREFTSDRWIPRTQRAYNAENVSIWWLHRVVIRFPQNAMLWHIHLNDSLSGCCKLTVTLVVQYGLKELGRQSVK